VFVGSLFQGKSSDLIYHIPFAVITILYFPHFITYNQVCNERNLTGATSEAGTDYHSRAPEF